MDEQNNGPVPGIIGQDIPSEPAVETAAPVAEAPKDDGKVFDSSAFTGIKQESLTFNADGEEKNAEPKKPNIFTKWQTWAVMSGAILIAGIAAVFVTVMIYEGKLSGSNAIARYDSLSSSLDTNKADFDKKLSEYTRIVYSDSVYNSSLTINPLSDYEANPERYIYPTDNDIHVAGNDCLKQDMFGLSDEDIAFIEVRKTGAELQNDGKDVSKETERLEKINNAYRSAAGSIENCHEPLINIKLKDFKIEIEDAEIKENDKGGIDVRRNVKITYKGDKELKSFMIVYGMMDKNGLVSEYQYTTSKGYGSTIKKGDVIQSRVCGGYSISSYNSTDTCVYTKEFSADQYKALKPKVLAISGSYVSKY